MSAIAGLGGGAAGSIYCRVASVAATPRPVPAPPRASQATLAARPPDLRESAVTPAAALLGDLIQRMGGAPASLARGAYVSVAI